MTTIRYRSRPVWRETGHVDRTSGRVMLAAQQPHALQLRMKGTRQVLELPWGSAWLKAAWLESARLRIERINKRRAKRQEGK